MAWLLGMFLLLLADNGLPTDNDAALTAPTDAQAYVADGAGGTPPK